MTLRPGTAFGHWQVSELFETRYDVPDQPMAGEMDSFFFLTKDRNFIPHEYPCRTAFAAAHRGRRPEVRANASTTPTPPPPPNQGSDSSDATPVTSRPEVLANASPTPPQPPSRGLVSSSVSPVAPPAFTRNWLPFGSPRLDLSGFWFRPTRIAAWARTCVEAEEAGTARLRLATCGGAVLYANGAEAGWLAPYIRNKEESVELDVPLRAGANEFTVFLDDLAERDTRFYVELDWLSGPAAHAVPPFDAALDLVTAVEATLGAMRFERPAYTGGEVAVALPRPLPVAASVEIAVEGDFMSHERLTLARDLPAWAERLVIGPAEDLPADFRHFHLTVTAGSFTASRVLGVEIAHPSAEAPADLAARAAEALEAVATRGERDTVCALARLATGRADAETEAMIDAALGPIADCWDCADFALVPLLWARMRYGGDLSDALRKRIDATILGYRYWMDEPGNDVQWYFSENHALLFHTAAYFAGHVLPAARFARSGRTGAEQSAVGRERVRAWLDHFEQWEMAEFNSAPYFPIDLKGLTALFALAPDPDIRERAGRGIARLLELVANSAHHGVLTAAQGRSYEHTLRAGLSLELSGVGRLVWGRGSYGSRFHTLPQLALCLRDHGLALAPDLRERAVMIGPGEAEWCFTQGENRFAHLYHAKTRDWAMGSAAHYRWFDWGYQETLIHARIGTEPQAQVWINHPGEVIHSGYGRPSFWGGSVSVPRVQQYRGLAIIVFDGVEPQPDFTHAWFPLPVFDEAEIDPHAAFARSGGGALALLADGPIEAVTTGPSADCELRLPGRTGRWLLRVGSAPDGLPSFRARFQAMSMTGATRDTITVEDPDYGPVRFHPDGLVEAEGRTLDPAGWSLAGERTRDVSGRAMVNQK